MFAAGFRLVLNPDPGFFTLTPARHPDNILAALVDFGLSRDAALDRWNKVAEQARLPSDSPLPPVYFHGLSEYYRRVPWEDPMRRIVFGVVRPTTDSPPQLRWTLACSSGDPEVALANSHFVFNGIQVGGRGSERGVLGVSGAFCLPRLLLTGATDFRLWAWKDPGGCCTV